MKVKLITCKSGCWKILICKNENEVIAQYSGHIISDFEWIDLLSKLGHTVEYIKLPDEKFEKWQEEI